MDVQAAVGSVPSGARGLLTAQTLLPLTLHGCEATLQVHGYGACLTLQLEYVNESDHNQSVIAAHAIPLHWQLMECAVHYDGADHVYTHYDNAPHAPSAHTTRTTTTTCGSQPAVPVYELEACTVAMQTVPWKMRMGSSMLLVARYAVPLTIAATTPRDVFELALPARLVLPPPAPHSPHTESLAYNALFAIREQGQVRRRLARGLSLRVEAALFSPLRGPVALTRGAAVTETYEDDDVLPCTVTYAGDTRFSLHYVNHDVDCATLYRTQRERPFVLRCRVLESSEPLRLFVEHDSAPHASSALAIALTPALAACEVNAECVFVLDLHHRESAESVAAALHLALHGLAAGVRVNVVLLDVTDHTHTALYQDGGVQVSQMNLDAVRDLVAAQPLPRHDPATPHGDAARLRVLQDVLERRGRCGGGESPSGYVRQVIYVSDAGLSGVLRPTACAALRAVRAARTTTRVSAVALCFSLNTDEALLRLLAREGGGVYAAATTTAEVTGAVVRVLAACAVPTLTRLQVSFPSCTAATTLRTTLEPHDALPVLAHGTRCCFYAFVPPDVDTVTVCVTGVVGDAMVEFTASCPMSHDDCVVNESDGLPLHVTAAAARIACVADLATTHTLSRAEVDEVVQLSRRHSLPSPFTQLYECGQSPDTTSSHAAAVQCWYSARGALCAAEWQLGHQAQLASHARCRHERRVHATAVAPRLPRAASTAESFAQDVIHSLLDHVLDAPSVERLLLLQHRESGGFALDARFAVCLGLREELLRRWQPETCPTSGLWATALGVAWMEHTQAAFSALAAERARRCLASTADVATETWQGWLSTARELLIQAS